MAPLLETARALRSRPEWLEAFDGAVVEVTDAARRLLTSLHTTAPARDREVEAQKHKERMRLRFTA